MIIYSLGDCGNHIIQPPHFINEKMKAKGRETFLRIFNLGVAEAICKPYLLTPSGMIFSPSGSEVGSDLGSCHALMPSSSANITNSKVWKTPFPYPWKPSPRRLKQWVMLLGVSLQN